MTVEALLEQLEDERMDVMMAVWTYGAKKQDALYDGDVNLAKVCEQIHDTNYKKAEHLSMIIKEIKKRVS